MVTQSHHTCFRGVVTYLLLFYVTVYNIVGSMQETVAVGGIMSICIYNLQLHFSSTQYVHSWFYFILPTQHSLTLNFFRYNGCK